MGNTKRFQNGSGKSEYMHRLARDFVACIHKIWGCRPGSKIRPLVFVDASARAFIKGIYAYERNTEVLCTRPYVKRLSAAYENTSDVNQFNCIL